MTSLRQAFVEEHPDFPLLELEQPTATEDFLRQRGWLEPEETITRSTRAGEGNMNLTLRVCTDRRRLIIKQSRPWVEKYDHIAAPLDRARVEARFYERIAAISEVAKRMPALLAFDPEARALLLEDLPGAQDLTHLYTEGDLAAEDAAELGIYLRHLHGETRGDPPDEALENRDMRRLNHRHIFEIPLLAENGVDLESYEPGLTAAASRLRGDPELRRRIERLGERYLDDGECLVHGDYFPGSWLRTDAGLRIIDPEFCFYGEPELDLGVAIAHLVLSRQSFGLDHELIEAAVDPSEEFVVEEVLVAQYAGVEVIRRLIGVAQLPIAPSTGFRASMLDRARVALTEETLEAFRT